MKILILEASTTSAKAMLYDGRSGILRQQSIPYDASVSDIYTHDPDRLYDRLLRVGRQTADGMAVDAIALVGSWHTILACDKDMHPRSRVITWNSPLAADFASSIRADKALSDTLHRATGCMPHAIYPLYMIRCLRDEGLSSADVQFCMEDAYLFFRMTGHVRMSTSSASGASLLDIHKLRYGDAALRVAGITAGQLPPLCDHTYQAPLTAEAASLLGLPEGTPVCASNPDGAMNQLGCSALQPGLMTLSVGTSAAMRLAVPKPDTTHLQDTWCYYAPGMWLHGAATSGATNCVDWFMHTFAAGRSFKEMEAGLKLHADSPTFLPFLYGERCPGWNDGAHATFYGLTGKHGLQDLYAAVLEGVAFQIVQCFRLLCEQQGHPAQILLSGGITKSPFWTALLVDALGQPVTLTATEQASMLGGAAIALHAMGELSALSAFCADDKPGATVSPDLEKAEFYRARYHTWLEKYALAGDA